MANEGLWTSFQRLLCASILVTSIPLVASCQMPQEITRLITELPQCTVLRLELERGLYGDGIEQSYMAKMRQQGIQRALIELGAIIPDGKPQNLHLERALYFRQLDGPNTQISDEETLRQIKTSGLQTELQGVALNRAMAAPLVKGPHKSSDKMISSIVEFFASPWLRQRSVVWVRAGRSSVLTPAVLSQDAKDTQTLLNSRRFSQRDLDLALFNAVISRYDNSAVIRLLLDAGAEVNARTPEGTTPLMNAALHPCNLRSLLDAGADVTARDKWGRTALQLARQAKESISIRLLEEAGSRPESSRD